MPSQQGYCWDIAGGSSACKPTSDVQNQFADESLLENDGNYGEIAFARKDFQRKCQLRSVAYGINQQIYGDVSTTFLAVQPYSVS